MALSSPISAPVKSGPTRTSAASAAVQGAGAPPIVLPLSFILVGLLALTVGFIWLLARPSLLATYHYNQYVIAVTHLFVLGWICSVVMGAMYQLVPVALETRLYSESLARWQFALHCIGFIGMVWMFNRWNLKQVGHFGSILTLGVILFVYNLAQTLRRVPKWNVTATAVTAALAWISLAVLAGLSIAAAKCVSDPDSSSAVSPSWVIRTLEPVAGRVRRFDPISAMHAHAHLGALGFFTVLIVGVSYKLIPMFTLSELQNKTRSFCSVAVLNLGLAFCFLAILLRWELRPVFSALVIVGLGLYGWELVAILSRRKRRAFDWGIRSFLTAVVLIVPVAILGFVLSWPNLPMNAITGQLENLYGFLAIMGVISLAIIGMLYKIIPFLVWFKSYSRQVGRFQVPALAELYSAGCQAVGYWAYLTGLISTSIGIVCSSEPVIRLGCLALAFSLLTLMVNIGLMFKHLFSPTLKPLVSNPSAR
jgi:hypothetical protein